MTNPFMQMVQEMREKQKRRIPKPKYTYELIGEEPHFHRKRKGKPRVVMTPVWRAHLIDQSKPARQARATKK